MTRLAKAPLIEAIVEIRWGLVKKDPAGIQLNFPEEEGKFFPGQFRAIATSRGYKVIENVNQPPFPHLINYRFRKAQDSWPCLQIGTGIFTVNQINEGYDWEPFKTAVFEGIDILDKSHPKNLKGLSPFYIELRYRDGFFLEENETSSQFVKTKLNFGFEPPDDFLKSPFLDKKPVSGHVISFQVDTILPQGLLIFTLNEAIINGKKGFVMDTIMRSEPTKLSLAFIKKWLEEAHTTQKHAFKTLIKPAYLGEFE
jgi:uncharacterized protein (TIGR04255 family)